MASSPGIAIAPSFPPVAWLYGRGFDLVFILGLAAVALLAGAAVTLHPGWFLPVFFLNMWLLGFPHVVATFTRLAFDRPTFHAHRFLTLGLPPLVLVAVVALGMSQGKWLLATIYLYWQAFHYARQSYGIAQAYARRPENAPGVDARLSRAVLYAVPLWGMLYRSVQAPPLFLGLPVWYLPVPEWLARGVGVGAAALILCWCVTQLRLARRDDGSFPVSHFLYMLTHIAVFTTGYLLIEDFDTGWLVVNIWHNAQYLAFVWYFNAKRFGAGIDPQRRFLSTLSQPGHASHFLAVCVGIGAVVYGLVFAASALIPLYPVTLAFLFGQATNYHHYIVDGIVWRRRAMAPAGAV